MLKRGSRHAVNADKALRWRVEKLLNLPYKEKKLLLVILYFMSRFAVAASLYLHESFQRRAATGFVKTVNKFRVSLVYLLLFSPHITVAELRRGLVS